MADTEGAAGAGSGVADSAGAGTGTGAGRSSAVEAFKAHYLDGCSAAGLKPVGVLVETLDAALGDGAVDGVEHLALNGNSKELFSARLTNADVGALMGAVVTSNVGIGHLDLSYNVLNDDGAEGIAAALTDTETYTCRINQLNLRGNELGAAGCRTLAKALTGNSSVEYLNLNGNPIGNEGGMAVAEMLYANTFISYLDIGNTDIGTETLIALATVLNTNATLQALSIENPSTFSKQEDQTYHLARMLQVNRTLRYLNLAKHGIRDFGASLLAEHLQENNTLQVLDLRCNSIAGVGGEALAGLLVRGSPLAEINLDNNRITDHGACALEQALRRNRALQVLSLRSNSIEDKGLAALAGALEENSTLKSLKLWVSRMPIGMLAGRRVCRRVSLRVATGTTGRVALCTGVRSCARPVAAAVTWSSLTLSR